MSNTMDSVSFEKLPMKVPQFSSSSIAPQDSMTTSNFSLDSLDIRDYLERKNLQFVSSLAPTLSYIAVLMVSGIVGNTFVFIVYYRRFRPSVTRTYILAMSVCDLMINLLCLPADIVEVRFHNTFDYSWACKVFRTAKSFLSISSAFILVVVAFDRQLAICSPRATPMTVKRARVVLVFVAVFAMAFTLPYTVLTGRRTVEHKDSNITGMECSIDNTYLKSRFLFVYNVVIGSMFIICVILMAVSYVRIAGKLWLHKKNTATTMGMVSGTGKRSKTTGTTSPSYMYTFEESSGDRSQQSIKVKDGQAGTGTDSTGTGLHQQEIKDKVTSPGAMIPLVENPNGTGASSCKDTTDDLPLQKDNRPTDTKTDGDMLTNGDSKESGEEEVRAANKKNSTVSGTNVDNDVTTRAVPKQRGLKSSRSRSILSGIRRPARDAKCVTSKRAANAKRGGSVRKIPTRTTFMMFVLTVIFIINYLPYLVCISMRAVAGEGPLLEGLGLNGYHVGLRSYLMNSAVNPLVYSFCSARFRQESQRLCNIKPN